MINMTDAEMKAHSLGWHAGYRAALEEHRHHELLEAAQEVLEADPTNLLAGMKDLRDAVNKSINWSNPE
jgi:hypothetical protein